MFLTYRTPVSGIFCGWQSGLLLPAIPTRAPAAPHVRNLTDEMLTAMGEKGCLIGLNYCASFLDTNPDRSQVRSRITDMARHARYIMDKAGEDCLALGSDFDGIDGDLEIAGAQDMPKLAEGLKKEGIPERVVEKIFYGNAVRFFSENL